MLHPDPALVRSLAADLAAAGYTTDGIQERWGAAGAAVRGRGPVVPAMRALGAATDPAALAARFFGLGRSVAGADLAAAFSGTGVAGLVSLGLARIDGALVVPLALIRPQEEIGAGGAGGWIASDLDEVALGGPLSEDHVLGVGGASLTLAGIQLTDPVGRVLDVGTGCGIQALRARRIADSVVATDVSARALAFAEVNALLNGVTGVELRRGDLFDPVAGELFDRVVSNPPFVITPRSGSVPAYEYRDGGRIGDGLVAEFVRGVGALLAPGGTAQLLGNWETRDGIAGIDRVRGWVAESVVPLDAWVVEREVLDPVAYAELWIRDAGTVPGTAAFDDLLGVWLDDFAARGVTAVGFGYLLLRRPEAGEPTLARYERLPQPLAEGRLGEHLTRVLAAHDVIRDLDDTALADVVLRVAGDVTEARHHLPGAEAPSVIELRQGGGFARTVSVDPALAALVGACDGDLSVGRLIDAIAVLLDAEPAALRSDLLPRIRSLVLDGFVEPVAVDGLDRLGGC